MARDNSAIAGATDYYPGGMPMPARNLQDAEGYRYGYQGEFAETDEETGKPAFELRLYDPRINRWLTTDPAGQYASPYLAMGNNWVSRIDPDGGEDWVYNKETGKYEWDESVTYASDPDLKSGYEYVGVGKADINSHFEKNNNFLTKFFNSPNIDVSSYQEYFYSEINGKLETFLGTWEAQRIDNIRGFYENLDFVGGAGINWGRFTIPLNININGVKLDNGNIKMRVFKDRHVNIFDRALFKREYYQGEVVKGVVHPYKIWLYSSRIKGINALPIITIDIHHNQGNNFNQLEKIYEGF